MVHNAAMAKAYAHWKVLPHEPIEKLGERTWRVEGSLPGMALKRVMTIAKRSDGGLVIHNAIALEPSAMANVEGWGKPSLLVVPNKYHRLDARVFKDRYPEMEVVAPAGARKGVEEVVPVDRDYDDEAVRDAKVELHHLEGVAEAEGYMLIRDEDGTTLVFNDALFNCPHLPGASGWIMRAITDSTGGPRVSRLFRWLAMKDRAALRAHFESLADTPDLKRIIVSHHETIDTDPADTLRQVAARL